MIKNINKLKKIKKYTRKVKYAKHFAFPDQTSKQHTFKALFRKTNSPSVEFGIFTLVRYY